MNDLLEAAAAELARARSLHPPPNPNILALAEEIGEFAEAVVREGAGSERAREEAVQVIAMVVRVCEEGDEVRGAAAHLLHELVKFGDGARLELEASKEKR